MNRERKREQLLYGLVESDDDVGGEREREGQTLTRLLRQITESNVDLAFFHSLSHREGIKEEGKRHQRTSTNGKELFVSFTLPLI